MVTGINISAIICLATVLRIHSKLAQVSIDEQNSMDEKLSTVYTVRQTLCDE